MKNLIRFKEPRTVRQARLAASALALATAVAAAAGILAGQGNAAPLLKADQGSYVSKKPKFKHPTLKRGLLAIEGTKASDRVALRLKIRNPRILQVDVGNNGSADFSFKRKKVKRIAVNARAGDDRVRIDERNGVFTGRIRTRIDGGAGNDTLVGGSGAETLLGGDGSDSLDGNKGNDLALLGAGDDSFVWDPGDGSDVVEGGAGADTMRFNGANLDEQIDVSANGNRLRFLRNPGTVTMDTAGLERIDFAALGGADLVNVNDLSGSGLGTLNLDLGVNGAGDGQPDRVVVNGTAGNDTIAASGDASGVAVSGLPVLVAIQHQEPSDELAVNGLGGNDQISAPTLAAQAIALSLEGDVGDDTLAGGKGVETLRGGDGNDSLDGNGGNDLALLAPATTP